jgi:hypothetical protein
VPVHAISHIRGGNLELFGHSSDGFDVRDDQHESGDDGIGELTIYTDQGFGNGEVRRPRANESATSSSPDNFRFDFGPGRIDVRSA